MKPLLLTVIMFSINCNSIGHKRFNVSLFVHNALILNDFKD